jgi:hypothetical protein
MDTYARDGMAMMFCSQADQVEMQEEAVNATNSCMRASSARKDGLQTSSRESKWVHLAHTAWTQNDPMK